MTSLQQAAGTTFSNTNNTNNQSKGGGGSGAFESCFSSGLDLSEFSGGRTANHGTATATTTTTSAAAQLLAVKAKETHLKQQQEQEELQMQQVIEKRTQQLEKSLSTAAAGFQGATMPKVEPPRTITIVGGKGPTTPGSVEGKDLLIGTDIFTTLVGMHGQDAHGGGGGGTRSSSSTRKANGKATRRTQSSSARQGTSFQMNKSRIVKKKHKRSKH